MRVSTLTLALTLTRTLALTLILTLTLALSMRSSRCISFILTSVNSSDSAIEKSWPVAVLTSSQWRSRMPCSGLGQGEG